MDAEAVKVDVEVAEALLVEVKIAVPDDVALTVVVVGVSDAVEVTEGVQVEECDPERVAVVEGVGVRDALKNNDSVPRALNVREEVMVNCESVTDNFGVAEEEGVVEVVRVANGERVKVKGGKGEDDVEGEAVSDFVK